MKTHIQNREGQKVVVVVEGAPDAAKLAFVMHGLGGNKEQPHLRAVAEALVAEGYRVVSFDTTNTMGESDGLFEDATLTGYYHDLQDVIAWAATQPWYVEPFVLAGHSLGGIATGLFAEAQPHTVSGWIGLSTVISGELTLLTPLDNPRSQYLDEWKRAGVRSYVERGITFRLKWACMEDRLKYSLLEQVEKLTMPVLLVVGEKDGVVPPEHQRILYAKLPGPKQLHVIAGAGHDLDRPGDGQELTRLVRAWAAKL